MLLRGKAHKFSDDISTDYIISSKYKGKLLDFREMAAHLMEDLDPEFVRKISAGDLIVAGTNFGCGSSREAAPRVIKAAGIGCVIATSFARIFYRNAINVGLPVVQCNTRRIDAGDELEVDLSTGVVVDKTKELTLESRPLPAIMLRILADGGLEEHIIRHGRFALA